MSSSSLSYHVHLCSQLISLIIPAPYTAEIRVVKYTAVKSQEGHLEQARTADMNMSGWGGDFQCTL